MILPCSPLAVDCEPLEVALDFNCVCARSIFSSLSRSLSEVQGDPAGCAAIIGESPRLSPPGSARLPRRVKQTVQGERIPILPLCEITELEIGNVRVFNSACVLLERRGKKVVDCLGHFTLVVAVAVNHKHLTRMCFIIIGEKERCVHFVSVQRRTEREREREKRVRVLD